MVANRFERRHNTGIPPNTLDRYRIPTSSKPIFSNTEPLNTHPYFSHLTTESHNGQRPIEVFFDTSVYGIGTPHIGFKLANGDNHKAASSSDSGIDGYFGEEDPKKPFRGLGTINRYTGEDQVVSKAYIAYVTDDGSLQLSEVNYRKGATPTERKLASVGNNGENGNNTDEIEEIIQVLMENKNKFLSGNSGIPQDDVNNHIKPVYGKLKALQQPKHYSIAPAERVPLRQAV